MEINMKTLIRLSAVIALLLAFQGAPAAAQQVHHIVIPVGVFFPHGGGVGPTAPSPDQEVITAFYQGGSLTDYGIRIGVSLDAFRAALAEFLDKKSARILEKQLIDNGIIVIVDGMVQPGPNANVGDDPPEASGIGG
jgi:hypothetical protein